MTPLISHKDAQLKRQVCSCLAQIAKHTQELAEEVVNHNIFPKIFGLLKDQDVVLRKNSATCIREIAKQSSELANHICNAGGGAALVEYISDSKGTNFFIIKKRQYKITWNYDFGIYRCI